MILFQEKRTKSRNSITIIFILYPSIRYIKRLFKRLIMAAAAACCLSLSLLPAIVLQTCAFFSPYWMKNNATSDCFRGLLYNSDCSDDVAGLGAAILGLQVIFFLLILLTTVSSVYLFCCKGKDSDEGCCAKICGTVCCLRSLSGIFGFSGCMVIVADYGDLDKGWAFYFSLLAACCVILETLLCCCASIVHATRSKSNPENHSQNTKEGGFMSKMLELKSYTCCCALSTQENKNNGIGEPSSGGQDMTLGTPSSASAGCKISGGQEMTLGANSSSSAGNKISGGQEMALGVLSSASAGCKISGGQEIQYEMYKMNYRKEVKNIYKSEQAFIRTQYISSTTVGNM